MRDSAMQQRNNNYYSSSPFCFISITIGSSDNNSFHPVCFAMSLMKLLLSSFLSFFLSYHQKIPHRIAWHFQSFLINVFKPRRAINFINVAKRKWPCNWPHCIFMKRLEEKKERKNENVPALSFTFFNQFRRTSENSS